MSYPQQQYPPQFQPQYPQAPQQQQAYPGYPQGYVQQPPQYQQPPARPAVNGSLDDFWNQPNVAGGPSLSFKDRPIGTRFDFIVERAIVDSDVQQQTNLTDGSPAFYRDGRPKFVMKVPALLASGPTPEFPEGKGTWYCSGQAREELRRAMAEAGAPEGAPEAGAAISVTLVARKPSRQPGFNPSNQVQVVYRRPPGAPAVETPSPAPEAQQAPAATPEQVPAQPQQPAQPAPVNAAPPQPIGTDTLTDEQKAFLATLVNNQQG